MLPAVVSDVDGVIRYGKDPVQGSREAVMELMSARDDLGRKIPFTFFSNNTAFSEKFGASAINKTLSLKKPSLLGLMKGQKDYSIGEDNMVLCETVLTSPHILERFQDKWVLVDGVLSYSEQIATKQGYKKVITLLELLSLYPEITALVYFDQ